MLRKCTILALCALLLGLLAACGEIDEPNGSVPNQDTLPASVPQPTPEVSTAGQNAGPGPGIPAENSGGADTGLTPITGITPDTTQPTVDTDDFAGDPNAGNVAGQQGGGGSDNPQAGLPGSGNADPALLEPCNVVQPVMNRTFSATSVVSYTLLTDPETGASVDACQLTITGDGTKFNDIDALMSDVRNVFEAALWQEDQQLVADGPTGTATGFRHEDDLALAVVEWQPGPDANCQPDALITDCDLTPAQKQYVIAVTIGEIE